MVLLYGVWVCPLCLHPHTHALTHTCWNVAVLHLPTRCGREALCLVCASLTAPFTAGLCLKLTSLSRDMCVNTLRGRKLDGSCVIAGDMYCNRFVQLKKQLLLPSGTYGIRQYVRSYHRCSPMVLWVLLPLFILDS